MKIIIAIIAVVLGLLAYNQYSTQEVTEETSSTFQELVNEIGLDSYGVELEQFAVRGDRTLFWGETPDGVDLKISVETNEAGFEDAIASLEQQRGPAAYFYRGDWHESAPWVSELRGLSYQVDTSRMEMEIYPSTNTQVLAKVSWDD